MNILIADDSRLILSIVKKIFFDAESKRTARDGAEGWELYQQQKPDVLICDQHMPKMNGMELIKRVREIDTETPIVLLTADLQDLLKDEAKDLRVNEVVNKPVDPQELRDKVLALYGS